MFTYVTHPPHSPYTVSPPPPPQKKRKKKKETRSLESFLESLMESIQQPLVIESLMLRLDVPHICVFENASYQRFFSILIKVEQLS